MRGDASPEKYCMVCGRRIEMRKKWKACWEDIRYCSDKCRKRKLNDKDVELESRILDLLDSRAKGSTICPSEVARLSYSEEEWRAHMEDVRMAARRMVVAGEVKITQKGKVVDASTAKGVIRIRRGM